MSHTYVKLHFLCLEALKDMTMVELNDKFFEGGGIGYTMRLVAGKVMMHEFMQEAYCVKFPKKYHKLWDEHVEYEKSFKGW